MEETNNTRKESIDEKNTIDNVCDDSTVDIDVSEYKSNIDSPNSLLPMVKNRDIHATKELVDMYTPLIKSEIRRVRTECMTREDEEDMFQESLLGFFRAVDDYEPNESVSFGLYAKVCIRNSLISYLRHYSRINPPGILLYNEEVENFQKNDTSESDPIMKIIEDENFFVLKERIENCLSRLEGRVWWMYVSGMKSCDIAKAIGGCDVRVVSNAIYRIRKKLRRLLS